jgi:hypothetical protein
MVLFLHMEDPVRIVYAHGSIPADELNSVYKNKAYIYFLEALAMVLAILVTSHLTPTNWADGTRMGAFIDNEAAKFALIKGYGKDPTMNSLLSIFWSHCATKRIHPSFQRVSTHANIADAVSREDFTTAQKEGWQRIHLDTKEILQEIQRATNDHERALQQSHLHINSAILAQLRAQLPPTMFTSTL